MRKIILGVIIVLLLICVGFTLIKGLNLFKVSGIKQIREKNNEIDNANNELTGLIDVTYPETIAKLDESSQTLKNTKQNYEEMALSARNNSYLQTDKYEIEFLWTKLGNYAKDEKVQIKIDVSNSAISGLFDLKFYIAGKYLKVKDFIYDLENDSKLGFKVEDFNMVAVGDDDVQGSFNCKEINIDLERIDSGTENTEEQNPTDANNTTENTTTDINAANNTTVNNEADANQTGETNIANENQ